MATETNQLREAAEEYLRLKAEWKTYITGELDSNVSLEDWLLKFNKIESTLATYAAEQLAGDGGSKWKTAKEAREWPEGFNIIVEETWHSKDVEIGDEPWRTLFYARKSNEAIDRAEKQGPDFTFRYLLESDLYGS